jgi:hypothetical protein
MQDNETTYTVVVDTLNLKIETLLSKLFSSLSLSIPKIILLQDWCNNPTQGIILLGKTYFKAVVQQFPSLASNITVLPHQDKLSNKPANKRFREEAVLTLQQLNVNSSKLNVSIAVTNPDILISDTSQQKNSVILTSYEVFILDAIQRIFPDCKFSILEEDKNGSK